MDVKVKALAGLSLIFILNDLAFIPLKSYAGWLAADYISRMLALAVIFYLVRSRSLSWSDFGFKKLGARPFIAWSLALTATGILIDRLGSGYLKCAMPSTALFAFPAADNAALKLVDLTFGMALVSLSEETVFRGLSASALSGRMGKAALVGVSCLLFGLIHWSSGVHAVVTTAIWGILPMVSVLRTGSIYPALVAHWATDLTFFLG